MQKKRFFTDSFKTSLIIRFSGEREKVKEREGERERERERERGR